MGNYPETSHRLPLWDPITSLTNHLPNSACHLIDAPACSPSLDHARFGGHHGAHQSLAGDAAVHLGLHHDGASPGGDRQAQGHTEGIREAVMSAYVGVREASQGVGLARRLGGKQDPVAGRVGDERRQRRGCEELKVSFERGRIWVRRYVIHLTGCLVGCVCGSSRRLMVGTAHLTMT